MQVECSYPVPPIRLYEVLTDLDFLIARNERYGGVGTPTVEQTGDALVVTTVRRIPLEHAPAVAHRFLGDGQLVQVDRWAPPTADRALAAVAIDPGRIPMQIRGSYDIRPVDDGCVYVAAIDLKVKVPLIGGAIASQVSGLMRQLLTAEMNFALEWLAR